MRKPKAVDGASQECWTDGATFVVAEIEAWKCDGVAGFSGCTPACLSLSCYRMTSAISNDWDTYPGDEYPCLKLLRYGE